MSVLPCFAENPAAVEAENYLPARGGDAKGEVTSSLKINCHGQLKDRYGSRHTLLDYGGLSCCKT